jgi:integrase/recombinase XerD
MPTLPPLNFQSFLAELMRDHLDYLDHLGFSIVQQAHNLRRIDRFLVEQRVSDLGQWDTRLLVEFTRQEQARVRATTVETYLDSWRRLSRYLIHRGRLRHNPLDGFPVPRSQPYRPHVFSPEELSRFFHFLTEQARQAPSPTERFRAWSYYTLYHLLYACGLRVSEAVRLRREDYSREQASLYICPSKFLKDRLIPVSVRVCHNLDQLLTLRNTMLDLGASDQLLVQPVSARPFQRHWVSARFRMILVTLGTYYPEYDDGRGCRCGTPHLHELRRAFAVHRLLRWYRQGANVDAKLPLLATYMGHAYFGHTKTYLTLTRQLLEQADQRFARHFDRLDWVRHDAAIE